MSGSWCTNALCKELSQFCDSDSLSEDGLREILERYSCEPNNNLDIDRYGFFNVACCNGSVTEGILRCLLEYFPDAATATTIGLTPLHVMCFNKNATRGMVQLLVDAYPESIDRAGRIGWTPLHQLSRNESLDDATAVGILGLLLERCPEAAQRADSDNGVLPIHAAVMSSKSLQFCRMLIEAYPGSERIAAPRGPDTRHGLPFHLACRGDNVALAEYFYKLYPESINVVTENTNEALSGLYPIHFAVIGGLKRGNPAAAVEMVEFLLDCDPNVSSQKFHGNLPLYWACNINGVSDAGSKVNAALKIAQALYDAYPQAIEEEDLSLLNNRFPEEIQAFINTQLTYARQARNTRQMNTPDMNGQLPLHRAFHSGNATLGSIKLLVKGNLDALRFPDNDGALPLHVACHHHESTKVVDYLIGLDPNTLTAMDRGGNTALHHACRGANHDMISLLLEDYGAVSVSKTNGHNKLPIHLLLESGATTNREDDTKFLESIFRLLRAYPDTLMMSEDIEQQQSISESSTSHVGKRRKICTD